MPKSKSKKNATQTTTTSSTTSTTEAKTKLTKTNSCAKNITTTSSTNNNDKKQQQLKYIASVVRALVTSRKPPSLLRDILREYPDVECQQLPFKQLGYNSAEDLLQESGEFIFNRIGGETCITAKYNVKTAHIESMVRSQKSGKSSRNAQRKQARKPLPSDQSWNKSSFSSSIFQKLPPSTNRFIESQNRAKKITTSGNSQNNNNNSRNNTNAQQQQKQREKNSERAGSQEEGLRDLLKTKFQSNTAVSCQKNNNNNNNNTTNNKINSNPQDLRFLLNSKEQEKQKQPKQQQQKMQNDNKPDLRERLIKKQQQKENMPRPILGQNNSGIVALATTTSTYQKQQQQQEFQQHSQQIQQQLMQNNGAIAIASSLILAQREQKNQEQRQQHRAELLSMQQQQQQQQLQRLNYVTSASATAAAAPPTNYQNNCILVSSGGMIIGPGSVQDRLRIKINNNVNNNNNTNNNSSNRLVANGGNGGGGTNSCNSSPVLSSAGSEPMQNPFAGQPKFHKQRIVQQQQQDLQPVIPPKVFQFNPNLDPVTSLSQYCVVRRYSMPEYSIVKSRFSKLYQCRVHVNGSIFSTYPNEYTSENMAKIACALQAIEQIKIQEARRPLPPCVDTDGELIDKIYNELQSHQHGMFAKNMAEWFEARYQQALPEHWWSLVQSSSRFLTETAASNDIIVFANLEADQDDNQTQSGSILNTVIKMEGITLPWSQKCWDLYITHCTSTVEVWARLFGKGYSEKFDSLMNEIDNYMLSAKTRPLAITSRHIYLIYISDCWHRVRVEEMDKQNGTALCFFIDFGDADWLCVNQLHICDTKFLKLPPQAVPFSLFGLEDFAGNPYSRSHLETMLSSKSVVAEILTKEADFYASESGKIQVVLYDTSSQEDINLNPLILKQICDDTQPPELKEKGVTNVVVTYVSDAGDVFLQIINSELKYVQKLMQQLIESKFKRNQHKVSRSDLNRSNLFLICDESDSDLAQPQWYRGALAETQCCTQIDEEFDIFYVDNGQTKSTHISNIFNLDSLSTALSKFPRQAIKARLYNIPKITKNIVGRMRALMPASCEVMVKVSNSAMVPLITVYRRLEGPDTLCTINDVIRIEQELEICSDITNAPEGSSTPTDGIRNVNFGIGGRVSPVSNSSLSPRTSSFIDMTRGLTITTSVPNSPLNSGDLLRLKSYQAIPAVGEFFEVRVTMSANPSNFTIQPYKDYPRLRTMMKELQEYCENNDEFIPVDMVEIGQAYAAKNPDGFYHRVTVVNTYNVEMIHVCFCDFGDIAILRNEQLKILPAKFRDLPTMAIQAKLYGITARNVDWTLEDCLRFRELTVGQKFVSIIQRITYDGLNKSDAPMLELDLVDVTTDEDIYIRDLLLKEDRALEVTTDRGVGIGLK